MAEARRVDVVVIGAGAAGLFCAARAGQRRRRVVLLEHGEKPGRKILISGGGRCNFTNLHCAPERFLSANPHFVKSALAQFTQHDFIERVRGRGIAFHEKTLGQLFCDGSAQAILSMLLEDCARGGVEVVLRAREIRVERVASESAAEPTRGKGAGRFRVASSQGVFEADALVIATGGLSIAKLGATGFGYEVARQFGLPIVAPRPGLVPLTLAEAGWTALAGVSAPVAAWADGSRARFEEKLLVTHRGVSGPAILQASSHWQPGCAVRVDFAPGERVFAGSAMAHRDERALREALRARLPQRLADFLAAALCPSRWTDAALAEVEARLHAFALMPNGSEGYEKAEVTVGGVDTRALNSRTMEARSVPGLYFIGEVVDVTGHLGGFNFQWAWSSAAACAGAL